MIYIILSLLCVTFIFIIFKLIPSLKIDLYQLVVFNFFTAFIFGLCVLIFTKSSINLNFINWYWLSIVIGLLFIFIFLLTGISSEKQGISITSVASKISFIFPVSFSILIDSNDNLNLLKFTGILIAFLSIFLVLYKKDEKLILNKSFFLPVFLFLVLGITDSFIKYAQIKYIDNQSSLIFCTSLFAFAFLFSIITSFIMRNKEISFFSTKQVLIGVSLGILNFLAMLLFMIGLNSKNHQGNSINGSVIFGINNIGIVCLCVLIGWIIFKEKLSIINWIGILLSIFAILLLTLS